MLKKIVRRIVDIISLCIIIFVLYLGYFIFLDKPVTSYEITSLYIQMGYAFLSLSIILIIRILLKKKIR